MSRNTPPTRGMHTSRRCRGVAFAMLLRCRQARQRSCVRALTLEPEKWQRTGKVGASVGRRAGPPNMFTAHSGAWRSAARRVMVEAPRGQSLAWSESGDKSSMVITRRLALVLHRESALAVLRRSPHVSASGVASGWEQPQRCFSVTATIVNNEGAPGS